MLEQVVTIHDLGRCFHLGNIEAVWKVVEVFDKVAMCQMVGTEDLAILPHEILVPLMDEYEEYWSALYCC